MPNASDEVDLTIESYGGDPKEAVRGLLELLAAYRDALDTAEKLVSRIHPPGQGARTH